MENKAERPSWYRQGYDDQAERNETRSTTQSPALPATRDRYGIEGADLTEYYHGCHDATIDYCLDALGTLVRGLTVPTEQSILIRQILRFANKQVERLPPEHR